MKQNFTLNDLSTLVEELNNIYFRKGYITTRVKVKVPQDINDGVLELEVIMRI